jgi:protein TonB
MIPDTGKPNLLLWGLIIISAGVHLTLLMHIAGLYRPGTPVYIELDLRTISKPIQRDIPRPQEIPQPRVSPVQKMSQDEPTEALPLENMSATTLPKPIPIPEIPEAKGVDVATWEGKIDETAPVVEDAAETEKEGETDAPVSAGEGGTETEEKLLAETVYRNQLNKKIPLIHAEADRLYRKKARKRQIQGRTVVRVVIDYNGDIIAADIAESSNHRILDQIALKAVSGASPFPKPPNPPTTLDIPINFKLI